MQDQSSSQCAMLTSDIMLRITMAKPTNDDDDGDKILMIKMTIMAILIIMIIMMIMMKMLIMVVMVVVVEARTYCQTHTKRYW